MSSELLTVDDPLLPRMTAAASRGHAAAFRWVLDSARRWAAGEYLRREKLRDTPGVASWGPAREADGLRTDQIGLERRMSAYGHSYAQVAVVIERFAVEVNQVLGDTIKVGRLLPGAGCEYLKLETSEALEAGMQHICDVFLLADAFEINPWPESWKVWPEKPTNRRPSRDRPGSLRSGDQKIITLTETITFS